MITTMSALPRLLNCPGSAVLPRADTESVWADAGVAEHEELSDLGSLPPELAKLIPDNALSEVKISYDVSTRVGRIIGHSPGRDYGDLGPFEIPGSIDVLGIDGDAVVILDWKTGYSDVEPAATNGQLWGYALAAARALGKDRAIVRIVYTKTKFVDEYHIDALELADFADRLEQLHLRVIELHSKRAEHVPTKEGSHCKYCPSKHACPSKNALLVQLGSNGLAVIGDALMTPERALSAYQQFVQVEQLVKDARARLQSYVDSHGPIDLGNGKLYGRYERAGDERLDGTVAVQAIREVVGESHREFEAVAIDRRTSKAALTRAAKAIGEKPKLATAVINKIRELGGATHAAPERPIGEFNGARHEAAPALDIEKVNRMLEIVR